MKMFKLVRTSKFWTIWFLLGLSGALVSTYFLNRENEEINNSLTMYVCTHPKAPVYVTLSKKFNEVDLNNYLKFIKDNTQSINFPGSAIGFNQVVHVVNVDNELGIAKVILLRSNSTLSLPRKEIHWIWVEYLSEVPCTL